jgi:RimJ/RimL family protein N-acetyltransferase
MIFINSMDELGARQISNWKYEGQYSLYSMDGSNECVSELLNGSYYLVKDEKEVIGFYCFGQAAQVSAGYLHGAYESNEIIDIGLGMRPDLCGKGLGYEFIIKEIEFAKALFGVDRLRLTVADFNERAIRVYERAGFKKIMDFNRTNEHGTTSFIVMELA